jgi:hypothetical protein
MLQGFRVKKHGSSVSLFNRCGNGTKKYRPVAFPITAQAKVSLPYSFQYFTEMTNENA